MNATVEWFNNLYRHNSSMETFWNECQEWQKKTFGGAEVRGPTGSLKHLIKEAKEALESVGTDNEHAKEEIVDCLFLVFEAAWRSGMTFNNVVKKANEKLQVNKSRNWNNVGVDEPVEHDRSDEVYQGKTCSRTECEKYMCKRVCGTPSANTTPEPFTEDSKSTPESVELPEAFDVTNAVNSSIQEKCFQILEAHKKGNLNYPEYFNYMSNAIDVFRYIHPWAAQNGGGGINAATAAFNGWLLGLNSNTLNTIETRRYSELQGGDILRGYDGINLVGYYKMHEDIKYMAKFVIDLFNK